MRTKGQKGFWERSRESLEQAGHRRSLEKKGARTALKKGPCKPAPAEMQSRTLDQNEPKGLGRHEEHILQRRVPGKRIHITPVSKLQTVFSG